MKYLIIGNSAAATGAVEGIRSLDASGEICLIGAENRSVYSRPLISYYLGGSVDEDHMYFRPPGFYQDHGVSALLGHQVTAVRPQNRQVLIEPSDEHLQYDRLLVTTGGHPVRPASFAGNFSNLFNFYTWDDVSSIADYLAKLNRQARVVVAGAGLIGLKAAESLIKKGHSVTVVEAATHILPSIVPPGAAARIQAHLESEGLVFCLERPVQHLSGRDAVERVILADNTEIACDMVIVAVGVRPEIAFLAGSGVDTDLGVLADQHLQSSQPDIYAAGDAAQAYDSFAGSHRVVPVWPFAYRQGYCAGINMAGGNMAWQGGPVFNSVPLLGLRIATGGQSSSETGEGLEIVESSRGRYLYRQLMLRDGRLVGFVLLGSLSGAGLYRDLVESGTEVGGITDRLCSFDFGIIDLPGAQQKVAAGGGY